MNSLVLTLMAPVVSSATGNDDDTLLEIGVPQFVHTLSYWQTFTTASVRKSRVTARKYKIVLLMSVSFFQPIYTTD